jgi:hypothetical protein
MSSSGSIDHNLDHELDHDLDPAIAEVVDAVTNRFGAEGLEEMIRYAERRLTEARAALEQLAEPGD